MFPLKATLSLLLVIGGAGAFLYVQQSGAAAEATRRSIDTHLEVAGRALGQAWQLDAQALRVLADGLAQTPSLGTALTRPLEHFAGPDGTLPSAEEHRYQIHRLINEELMVWKEKLATGGRHGPPELLAVVDAAGLGVGLASDPAWFGPTAALGAEQPSLLPALAAPSVTHTVWLHKDAPLEVAIAPVRVAGQVVGGVVVGHRFTLATAQRSKALAGAEVAWFVGPRVGQSASFGPELAQALSKALADQKLHEQTSTQDLTLNGRLYRATFGQVGTDPQPVGFVALVDLGQALAQASEPLTTLLLVMGGGLLVAIALVLLFFAQWVKPFETLEKGVMELINDNKDYWFDVKGGGVAGRLSQNLNIMVCHLTGRPLPDDNERTGS